MAKKKSYGNESITCLLYTSDINYRAECHNHGAAALFGLAGTLSAAAGPPDLHLLSLLLENVVHRVIIRRLVRRAVGDKAGGQIIAEGIQIFLIAEFRGLDCLRGALGVVRLVAVQLLAQVLELSLIHISPTILADFVRPPFSRPILYIVYSSFRCDGLKPSISGMARETMTLMA